jgi:hypothetical protein
VADVEVTIFDLTKPITQKGFGLPLVLDLTKNVPYTEATETSEFPAPLVSSDMAYKMASRMLEQSPSPEKVAIYGYDMDQEGGVKTIEEILNALVVEHNLWYFIVLADRVLANIKSVATWAGANKKFFVTCLAKATTVADIATAAGEIASDRCAIFQHDGGTADEDPFLDAAIVGRMCPTFPGASTWKFKSLNGVPVSTYLNAEISTLHTAKVNGYWNVLGDDITSEGKETKGGYIDIRIAKDWLEARLIENVTQLLHTVEKIPYDDTGIAMVCARVKEILQYAVGKSIIARDLQGNGLYTLTPPKRADIPTNTRANRILPDIAFDAVVAGAVHQVQITGVVRV